MQPLVAVRDEEIRIRLPHIHLHHADALRAIHQRQHPRLATRRRHRLEREPHPGQRRDHVEHRNPGRLALGPRGGDDLVVLARVAERDAPCRDAPRV